MTTPAPSPSKRLYVMWGVALGLLVALAIFCWSVVMPALQVREVLRDCPRSMGGHYDGSVSWTDQIFDRAEAMVLIQRLGGPEKATPKLGLYARLPRWAAEGNDRCCGLLAHCGRAGAETLGSLLNCRDLSVAACAANSSASCSARCSVRLKMVVSAP